jgi:DNA polymerase III subunit gamma/tau
MPVLRLPGQRRPPAIRGAVLWLGAIAMVVFVVAFAAGTDAPRAGQGPISRGVARTTGTSPAPAPRLEPVPALPELRGTGTAARARVAAPTPVPAAVTTPPAPAATVPPPTATTEPQPVQRPPARRQAPPAASPPPSPAPAGETFDSSG